MEYNTQRAHLKLREYGRNVQNLVAHLQTIEDKEERSKKAATVIELMKSLNPNINQNSNELDQKVWDDLHIISNFELDLDSDFEKPSAEVLTKKPERLKYFSNQPRFKHYGRSVEILIEQAIQMEDEKEREGAVVAIGRLMKSFYQTWNKDTIEDEQVLKNIKILSKNQLDINIETVKELGLFDAQRRNYRSNNRHKGGRRHSNGKPQRRNNTYAKNGRKKTN